MSLLGRLAQVDSQVFTQFSLHTIRTDAHTRTHARTHTHNLLHTFTFLLLALPLYIVTCRMIQNEHFIDDLFIFKFCFLCSLYTPTN